MSSEQEGPNVEWLLQLLTNSSSSWMRVNSGPSSESAANFSNGLRPSTAAQKRKLPLNYVAPLAFEESTIA